MKTILILEDQALIRDSWKSMLEEQAEFKVIAETADLESAKLLLTQVKPDVLLTGIFLNNATALPVIASLKQVSPATKTVILSSMDEPAYIEIMLQQGVSAYLTKNCNKQELLEGLAATNGNQIFLSNDVRVTMFNRPRKRVDINRREFETLRLLTRTLTNSQIAKHLDRAVKTIEAINTGLYKKTGAVNREELIAIAHKNALDIEVEFIINRTSLYC
jgi:DNA-binding NarL/FixJ family response regulator